MRILSLVGLEVIAAFAVLHPGEDANRHLSLVNLGEHTYLLQIRQPHHLHSLEYNQSQLSPSSSSTAQTQQPPADPIMHLSALPRLALAAALALGTATQALEMQTTITTGSVVVPIVSTWLTADNGDYYPLGYLLDGCTSRGNARSVCRDSSRKRGHVIWHDGSRQCMHETSRNTIRDGRNSYEYIHYSGVGCSW
ncbi:hypothetical protein Micbo1qcDRAFT_206980 [Microdochium bolleyi]|uniref:Uncharacterized protein n=1 Tax=Microdochium bolleyi TaxID=196109 RepID=A0A136IV92_9PEZI|nr:hypothetical protein Micbo1qcDRAFT_206980 [Microdochium bolleyi]